MILYAERQRVNKKVYRVVRGRRHRPSAHPGRPQLQARLRLTRLMAWRTGHIAASGRCAFCTSQAGEPPHVPVYHCLLEDEVEAAWLCAIVFILYTVSDKECGTHAQCSTFGCHTKAPKKLPPPPPARKQAFNLRDECAVDLCL